MDRALQLSPQDREALVARIVARRKTGDVLGSARDLIVARHLDPVDDSVAENVDWTVKKLRYDGQELTKLGHHEQAAQRYDLGLQLAPHDNDLRNRSAWNDRAMSIEQLMAKLDSAPDDFRLRLRIDHALAAKRRFDEVVKIWDAFIADHPQDPRPYQERGGARWHLGQHADAIADTQKACDLGLEDACRDVPRMKARTPR